MIIKNSIWYTRIGAMLLIGSVAFMGSTVFSGDIDPYKKVKAEHEKIINNSTDSFIRYLKENMKGEYVVGRCSGSFIKAGDTEIALVMINSKTRQVRYIVLYGYGYNKKSRAIKSRTMLLSKFPITKKMEANHPRGEITTLEVSCYSKMEILRLNEAIWGSVGIHGRMKPISDHDAICVQPEGSPTEFSCHMYDKKKKKFISIGGWIT